MASYNDNKNFAKEVLETDYFLDKVIDYLNDNHHPADIFNKDLLEEWAELNGYERKNENE